MPIVIICPACGSKAQAPDGAAGRKVKCPKCGGAISVGQGVPTPAPRRQTDVQAEGDAERKQCPYCSETILATARKCKHCGEILDPELKAVSEAGEQGPAAANGRRRGR